MQFMNTRAEVRGAQLDNKRPAVRPSPPRGATHLTPGPPRPRRVTLLFNHTSFCLGLCIAHTSKSVPCLARIPSQDDPRMPCVYALWSIFWHSGWKERRILGKRPLEEFQRRKFVVKARVPGPLEVPLSSTRGRNDAWGKLFVDARILSFGLAHH